MYVGVPKTNYVGVPKTKQGAFFNRPVTTDPLTVRGLKALREPSGPKMVRRMSETRHFQQLYDRNWHTTIQVSGSPRASQPREHTSRS